MDARETRTSHEVVPTDGVMPVAEVSIFHLGSVLLHHRWRLIRWALVGGLLAVVPALLAERDWTADASFVPQETDAGNPGLRSLAGQFGVMIPGVNASNARSPDFYADLLTSRVILGSVVDGGIDVQGERDREVASELLASEVVDTAARRQAAILGLRRSIRASVARLTGAVELEVTTPSPRVSYLIAARLLEEINRFNLETRQSQAAQERRFVGQRMDAAREAVAATERELSEFMQANRQFSLSPDLKFEYDRLERDLALHQQVLVGLAQSYEEARIREVRDLPVINVIEPPAVPVYPDGRGLTVRLLVGLVLGAGFAAIASFVGAVYAHRRAVGDADAARFAVLLREARSDLTRWLRPRRQVRDASVR